MDRGLGLIVNNITGCDRTATVANSRVVDDMLSKIVYRDSSIDGLNQRSVQQFMRYNGIEESPLIIAIIINYYTRLYSYKIDEW